MTAERAAKLEALDFTWAFMKLDRSVPSEGMTAARAAKLEALDFDSAPHSGGAETARYDAGWEAQLAKLKTYKHIHGDCNVPQRWAEDSTLGGWVNTQRKRKKALDCGEPSRGMTVERAAKLEALGFAWELSAAALSKQNSKVYRDDAGWEAQLAKLKVYKRRHGDCCVPQRWAEDPRLGGWVDTQRQRKRKLDRGELSNGMTAERAAKLEALGFAWELSAAAISIQNSKGASDDARWEAQLAKLKVYKRRHGDCNVPKRWAEDPRLGSWVGTQRKCKRKLDRGELSNGMTAERAAKLEALGFAWELSTAAQKNPHRTQADETAEAFEVEAVAGKRKGKARRGRTAVLPLSLVPFSFKRRMAIGRTSDPRAE
jgi:hypothetical protein